MKTITILCAALLLSGCLGASTDPNQGGLFGYSPEAYGQRKAEREERLKELQREQADEERRQENLKLTAAQKEDERAALRQKLQETEAESAGLKKKLDGFKAQNSAQEAALKDLRTRQARLQTDIQANSGVGKGGSDAERQAEAERLRREVERLARDTEALSGL